MYPLNLKEVRQAMDVAIGRKRIADDAFQGYMEYPPTMGYVPPMVTKWLNPEVIWSWVDMTEEDRISKANAMLDELGFKLGKDGIRRTEEGEKLHFRLRTMSTNPSYIRASEMVLRDLAKIGIEVEILTSDPQTLYGGIIYSGKNTEDWELMVHGTIMDPDPEHVARSWAPETPTPWDNATAFGYKNEELRSLLQKSTKEMDFEKRHEMIMEAQVLIADDLPVIMLGHRMLIMVYRTDKYTNWNLAEICYIGMFYSSASIVNLISLRP
ncbi:Periplasmic dipeptide transport protein [subsurface metagenome]